MHFLLKWLFNVLAIGLSAYILHGVSVDSFWAALWVSVFLAVVNVLLKPILVLLTLPINIITLGLFTFVINAGLILLAESVIKGFHVDGFLAALLYAVVLAIVNWALNLIIGDRR